MFLVKIISVFTCIAQNLEGSVQIHSSTIIFVHGMFFNGEYWKEWKSYFESQGYTCYSPSWPYHDKNISELQRFPDKKLGHLNLTQITGRYEKFIDSLKLPDKPILVGHSMGGLVVQQLLERSRGSAGILISTAPPKWILSMKPSFFRSNLPILYPFAVHKPYRPSLDHFNYALANTLPLDQQRKVYYHLSVPETRIVEWNLFGDRSKINFKKVNQPLLFLSGSEDRIIPSSLVQKTYRKYRKTNSFTEYKSYLGKSHLLILESDWQLVAQYVDKWIQQHSQIKIVESK